MQFCQLFWAGEYKHAFLSFLAILGSLFMGQQGQGWAAGECQHWGRGREFPVSFHLPLAHEARSQLLLLCSLISFLSTEREEERISLMFINI